MNEQEKQKFEEEKENLKKNLTDFFSALTEKIIEAGKALQAYPDKRIVEKAIHGRTEKIKRKNMKKILDWYRKKNL